MYNHLKVNNAFHNNITFNRMILQQTYQKNNLRFLIKSRHDKPISKSVNIFEVEKPVDPIEYDEYKRIKKYSIAGDPVFIERFTQRNTNKQQIENTKKEYKTIPVTESIPPPANNDTVRERLLENTNRSRNFNSSVMSRMSKHQKLFLTKEKRNIEQFQKQSKYWEKANKQYQVTDNQRKTLFERANSKIKALPNERQIDLLNEHIVHYWEMSLRNNHKTILKHVEGAPFNQKEFQELLQTKRGKQLIQSNVPDLDIDSIKNLQPHQLRIVAKSKAQLELSSTQRSSTNQNTKKYPEFIDEVLKADWNRKELSRKNAHMLPKLAIK